MYRKYIYWIFKPPPQWAPPRKVARYSLWEPSWQEKANLWKDEHISFYMSRCFFWGRVSNCQICQMDPGVLDLEPPLSHSHSCRIQNPDFEGQWFAQESKSNWLFFLVLFEGFVQMLTHLLFFRGSLIIDQQVRQVDKLFIGTEQI